MEQSMNYSIFAQNITSKDILRDNITKKAKLYPLVTDKL